MLHCRLQCRRHGSGEARIAILEGAEEVLLTLLRRVELAGRMMPTCVLKHVLVELLRGDLGDPGSDTGGKFQEHL
jgi:hypothetical protein